MSDVYQVYTGTPYVEFTLLEGGQQFIILALVQDFDRGFYTNSPMWF